MSPDYQSLIDSLRRQLAAEPQLDPLFVESLALPSVRLTPRRVSDEGLDAGASRIGGTPDVPAGFKWPRWMPSRPRRDKFGETWNCNGPSPLGFIAQVDLSAIPRVSTVLPNSGWICFFYDRYCEPWGFDPADRGACRVTYFDCPRSHLRRAVVPDDLDGEHLANLCSVEAIAELTLPEHLPGVEYGSPAFAAYRELCECLMEANGPRQHRFLGHAQPIQNPMELECQLVSNGVYCGRTEGYRSAEARALASGAVDWRLLLQIDTDEAGPGWMWGDVGRIYFWIKQRDLAALRFEDVWLILQCC